MNNIWTFPTTLTYLQRVNAFHYYLLFIKEILHLIFTNTFIAYSNITLYFVRNIDHRNKHVLTLLAFV